MMQLNAEYAQKMMAKQQGLYARRVVDLQDTLDMWGLTRTEHAHLTEAAAKAETLELALAAFDSEDEDHLFAANRAIPVMTTASPGVLALYLAPIIDGPADGPEFDDLPF